MYAFKKNKTRFDFVQFDADTPIAHDSGIELLLSGTTTTPTYKQTKDEKPYLILERNVEHCSKDIDVQIYEKQVVYNNDYILKIYETVVDIESFEKENMPTNTYRREAKFIVLSEEDFKKQYDVATN